MIENRLHSAKISGNTDDCINIFAAPIRICQYLPRILREELFRCRINKTENGANNKKKGKGKGKKAFQSRARRKI